MKSWNLKINFFVTLLVVSTFFSIGFSQKKDPFIQIRVQKKGVYFGLQQGRYTFAELGTELQLKELKVRKPITQAIQLGAEYNLFENVLGFNLGAYRKPGRFDFTYGFNVLFRSNFSENRFAFGPSVGYKIFGLHAQTGYLFHTPANSFDTINRLYISLRFLLVKNRKTTFKRKNKA